MAVKIRLQRRGRKQRPFYHIVVADARAPRDGRFIEKLGIYNPMTKPATIELDQMAAYDWLTKGAQPTDTARAILRFKGVLYYKHLMRGVKKGALTEEQAMAKWKAWDEDKTSKIRARFEESAKERAAFLAMVSGEIQKVAPKVEETAADDSANPQAVADSQKTLAEMAAEKDGDLLNMSQETAETAVEETTEAAEETVETAAEETAEAAAEETTETVEEAAEETPEAPVEEATEAVEETVEASTEETTEVADAAEETTEAASEEATEESTDEAESSSEEE